MSEENFLIERTEDGEISATFTPSKVSFSDTADVKKFESDTADVKKFESDTADIKKVESEPAVITCETVDHSPQPAIDDDQNQYNLIKTSDQGNTESDIKNGSQSSNNGNQDFGKPSSTSTPVLKERVVSACDSDKSPLLQKTSSMSDSCIGLDVEGETENPSEASCACSLHGYEDCPEHGSMRNVMIGSETERKDSLMMPGAIRVPIVGHETMEASSKYTVFKIHVMVEDDDTGWFIFRRYSDFVRLNDQLRDLFPNFRLALPPKRWFRSNYDIEFLEERQLGLQAFVDNVTGHRDICGSKPVRTFFCFDEPPGPHDTLEESRAQCECMEEMVYLLRKELSEKESDMELLQEELELYKNQVQLLTNRLSELNRLHTLDRQGSEKGQSSSTRQYDIDSLFGAGDKLLTDKLP